MTIKIKKNTAIILDGGTKHNGNTAILVDWLQKSLKEYNWKVTTHHLYQLNFKGCIHCDCCTKVTDSPGCVLKDDLENVLDSLQDVELIVIASPVYCWATSGCMSTALDRFYSLFNKGEQHSLIAEKKILGAFTGGGNAFDGMDLCVAMLKQLCAHSHAKYIGTIAVTECTTPDELLTRKNVKTEIRDVIEALQ
jgi:multimeric flavodoxin WrbA